jgi:GT2 family glycosyltransferase
VDSVKLSTIKTNIIVVDNGSTDGTLLFVKNKYPDVKIFEQQKNLGFGQANNIAITYALQNEADYVYLLNQDAWIQLQTIEILIQNHIKYPEFGILSPMQTTATLEKLDKNFAFSCKSAVYESVINEMYFKPTTTDIYQVDFAPAAHWLISRECLMAVGGFSPTFFHYGEDINYVDRAHYHNFKTGICPQSLADHDREFRKENKEKQIYKAFVMIVCNCSNINNRRWATIINSFYFLFKLSFKNNSLVAFQYAIRFLFLIPKIIHNNRISRKRYPNFLAYS